MPSDSPSASSPAPSPTCRRSVVIGFDGATWTLLDRMIARGVMPNLGALRDRGIIKRPEDLGIDKRLATRDLLAARTIKDLVRASGGLYDPPKRFRNW